MDDTQLKTQNVKLKTDDQAQVPQPVPTPVQPVVPVSGGAKEKLATAVTPKEWVSASTPEVVLPKEVQEAGVEATPVMPSVPSAAQAAGVQHAKEATPVSPVATEPLGIN